MTRFNLSETSKLRESPYFNYVINWTFEKNDLEYEEEIKQCFHWTNMCPLEKNKNLQKSNKIHWPYIFVQEIRLRKFIKENHIEEDIIQEWINGALTTAVYGKP